MIRTTFNKISGIYQIKSSINNKIYIGSAVNLKHRKYHHFYALQLNKHHSILLQRHFNKYGIDDLQFSIITYIPKEKLIEIEQSYLDILKPEFNICKRAGSTLGVTPSKETKKKIAISLTGIKQLESTRKKKKSIYERKKVFAGA